MWQHIMEDDEKFDYSSPNSPPSVREEISVYTSSGGANFEDSDPETED